MNTTDIQKEKERKKTYRANSRFSLKNSEEKSIKYGFYLKNVVSPITKNMEEVNQLICLFY
jgi:hypothetical protein